jgi:membrane fusion protein (multidrug efflux system)
MRRKRCIRILVAVAGAQAVLGCGGGEAVTEAPGHPVVITPVEVRDVEERIETSGELLAKDRADVAAQVSGEITEILFEEGDAVEAGAVVVEIDQERRQLEVERVRARVGEARAGVSEQKREVERVRVLAGKNVASETQLDQAETQFQTAQSRLSAAQAELGVAERALRDATVNAAFSGRIAQRYVHRGEFVREGELLFELVSLDPIEVEFHLPEADAARVREGQPIEVTVSPYPDEVFDAIVTVVSPTIDRRTRTLRVRALVPNPDHRLRPGFFARANLGVARREGVLIVPEEAVLQRADGAVVFKVGADDRVVRVPVEIGRVSNGSVEVKSGLARGDLVVSRGHADLIDGSKVVARNPDGSDVTPAVASPTAAAAVKAEAEAATP